MSDVPGARVFQASGSGGSITAANTLDPDILDILVLRARNRDRVVEVLSREDGLTPVLVPHVIPLLAWEPVADYAFFALRKVAEERIGELADALLNPGQNPAVRLGIARVLVRLRVATRRRQRRSGARGFVLRGPIAGGPLARGDHGEEPAGACQ